MCPEPICSHRIFDVKCPLCAEALECSAEEIERDIEKAYAEGELRGVTHYVLDIRNVRPQ